MKSFTQKKLEWKSKFEDNGMVQSMWKASDFNLHQYELLLKLFDKLILSESIEQARAEERKMIRDWVANLPKGKTPAEEKIIQSIVDFLNNQDK